MISHAQLWRDIGPSPWVMRVTEQSYSLIFTEEPPPAFYMNNQSDFKHQAFVSSVADNSKMLRLILDLRYLNSFLSVPKYKYKDVCTIRDLFDKGDFFFKFNIKHGYHHVNIDKAYHKYLSFSWSEDGVTK